MNVVKVLEKQLAAGKDVIMADGAVVGKDEIRKAAMKQYLAGVKSGEISPAKSFDDYVNEMTQDVLPVEDAIAYLKGEDAGDENEDAE